MILRLHAAPSDARGHGRVVKDGGEVQTARLPVIDSRFHIEHIDAANHLVARTESQFGHVLAKLLCNEEKEIDHVLRLTFELLAQFRIVRGGTHRASVEVALAHHDAAHCDQGSRSKTEFFGTQQGGNRHITAGLELAVSLHTNAAAQIVQEKDLLSFRESQFPRDASMLDGAQWRRAGATGVAADQDDVSMSLRNARCNRAYTHLGYQLHCDARVRVDVLQVVDQLREVFDRIDVVMWRRRDQSNARDGVPQASDHVVDLVAGELSAFAGFRALRHFDLQLVSVHQIVCSHTETRRGYLLHRAASQVAARVRRKARFVLPAFAGVGLAADAVHGDGQRLVRLLANRTERHGARGKALHNLFGGLDFVKRQRRVPLPQLHYAA